MGYCFFLFTTGLTRLLASLLGGDEMSRASWHTIVPVIHIKLRSVEEIRPHRLVSALDKLLGDGFCCRRHVGCKIHAPPLPIKVSVQMLGRHTPEPFL